MSVALFVRHTWVMFGCERVPAFGVRFPHDVFDRCVLWLCIMLFRSMLCTHFYLPSLSPSPPPSRKGDSSNFWIPSLTSTHGCTVICRSFPSACLSDVCLWVCSWFSGPRFIVMLCGFVSCGLCRYCVLGVCDCSIWSVLRPMGDTFHGVMYGFQSKASHVIVIIHASHFKLQWSIR